VRVRTVVLLLAACGSGAKRPPEVAWEDTPKLPSPTSATYAIVPAVPPDPGVALVLAGQSWDASLGGAAAGLALAVVSDSGSITPPEVREAAWRAGWPYAVHEVRAWATKAGEPPPEDVKTWLLQWVGASIGLVRARGGVEDVWIGLAARPPLDLGPLPRQLPQGGAFEMAAVPGGRLRAADPEGTIVEFDLSTDFSTKVEIEGEWLVEIDREGIVLAQFPVYVGLVPPEFGLLVPTRLPDEAPMADALAVARLTEVREEALFGLTSAVSSRGVQLALVVARDRSD
jgi:hypothetical protein